MFLSPTGIVGDVITQWGGQQPFQRGDPPEVEKHESFEIDGTHPSHKIVRQRGQVEGQEKWRHRDRELLQLVLGRESVHLYTHGRCSGEHQIVQWTVLRSVSGEWEAILDDRRKTS